MVVEGVILKTNLIPLEMTDFDMILGMDWLSSHRASMDCFTKKIVFRKPGYPKLEFEGDRQILPTCVISALEAKRLLHKGCEAYLAHVLDKSSPKMTIKNVPIVCEFSDVFHDDLSSLPPDRELEFEIELLLGSALVFIPSYKMAPTEFKELKVQLQDLVDKGFIRPSVSPWDAPVLFVKKKDGTCSCVSIIANSTKSQSRINTLYQESTTCSTN